MTFEINTNYATFDIHRFIPHCIVYSVWNVKPDIAKIMAAMPEVLLLCKLNRDILDISRKTTIFLMIRQSNKKVEKATRLNPLPHIAMPIGTVF